MQNMVSRWRWSASNRQVRTSQPCSTGEALHVLSGAATGPQDGPGLVAANRDYIERLVAMKRAAGEKPASVVVTGMDIEGQELLP